MSIKDFLTPLNVEEFGEERGSINLYGNQVKKNLGEVPDLEGVDLILLGVNEIRNRHNQYLAPDISHSANAMRRQFYKLYRGNYQVNIADLGNIEAGKTFSDTAYALQATMQYLLDHQKVIIVFGTHQELIPYQYKSYESTTKALNLTVLDSLLNLEELEGEEGYLIQIIKHSPEFLFNISHLGGQMYLNEPGAGRLMDAMLFDVFRLGVLRKNLADAEPTFRNADMVCMNMSAIKQVDMPAQLQGSANGLMSEEACVMMRYAGMGNTVRSLGLYDYFNVLDSGEQGSKLAAQMLWHFVDGYYNRVEENPLVNEQNFIRYRIALNPDFAHQMVFYKSLITERWYLEVSSNHHGRSFVLPCSYTDYQMAEKGDIPDRWMKATQKLM